MLDTVRDKLQTIYNAVGGPLYTILNIFIEQFGADNVDSSVKTFDEFLEALKGKTLGTMGISTFTGSNSYGHYEMDRADYEANGRGKSVLEYVPDLGILDYLTPRFAEIIMSPENNFIMVHFPKVRVCNEYDKCIDIQDLYAKILITTDGRLMEGFRMTRTTFPYSHFKAQYAHSHLPKVYKNDIGVWKHPCLGSGPLSYTQPTLKARYDEQMWGLFAFELSKYVTIESISGGPYIRLETVGKGDIVGDYHSFQNSTSGVPDNDTNFNLLLNRFVKHYAKENKFRVKYMNGQYQLGESTVDACVHLSNDFIEWYDRSAYGHLHVPTLKQLTDKGVLSSYIVSSGAIYSPHNNDGLGVRDAMEVNGRPLFKFKGEQVSLRITDITEEMASNRNTSLLFTKVYCECIIARILNIINYKYGKRNGEKRQGSATKTETGKKSCII